MYYYEVNFSKVFTEQDIDSYLEQEEGRKYD